MCHEQCSPCNVCCIHSGTERFLLLLRRYDDLKNYSNDRSIFLANLRDAIEAPWQAWELQQLPVRRDLAIEEVDICSVLLICSRSCLVCVYICLRICIPVHPQ